MNKFFLLIPAVICILSSCEESAEVNSEAIRKELKERKIQRISEADFTLMAEEAGQMIASAIVSMEPERVDFYLKEFGKKYDMEIKFITLADAKDSSKEEAELLDAYAYNVENNLSLVHNIQKLSSGNLLYTFPLVEKEGKKELKGIWSMNFDKPGLMRFNSDLKMKD